MALSDDLERISVTAERLARPGERLSGIVAAQPLGHGRIYLCAYDTDSGVAWLALGEDERAIADRSALREAAQLAGLCEVAEESAGGGDVDQLIARLVEIRETDAPAGIEEAEEAARALAAAIEPPPRVATTAYLDRLGAASRRLEQALGDEAGSPFAAAIQSALAAVEELAAEVERTYRGPLA
jgi:hypothetical protein